MAMPLGHIKESLSRRYVEVLANRYGYTTAVPEHDNGVDMSIHEVALRLNDDSGKRYFETGRRLELQIKSTTEKSITFKDKHILYDIEAKTWNDLIQRRLGTTPLILVLFVLPIAEELWLEASDEELILRKCAYWFLPEETDKWSNNASTVRIKIPLTQTIINNRFDELIDLFG
jgi:hypothetical protein